MLNKKTNDGGWEHQDTLWTIKDGYIQDQNSSNVLKLMDDAKASGTRVILTTNPNTSDSTLWFKEFLYDRWFYLKPIGLDMFLTAESNNLTTVTGNDHGLNLFLLSNDLIERLVSILFDISNNFTQVNYLYEIVAYECCL